MKLSCAIISAFLVASAASAPAMTTQAPATITATPPAGSSDLGPILTAPPDQFLFPRDDSHKTSNMYGDEFFMARNNAHNDQKDKRSEARDEPDNKTKSAPLTSSTLGSDQPTPNAPRNVEKRAPNSFVDFWRSFLK